MLYDKRWDQAPAKVDVFSLESLIAWLETMPGGRRLLLLASWALSDRPISRFHGLHERKHRTRHLPLRSSAPRPQTASASLGDNRDWLLSQLG